MSTSLLAPPSKGSATAQLLTENWLRNVFSTNLHTVSAHAAEADHAPGVVVARAHAGENEPPVLVVTISDAPVSDETVEEAGRYAAAGVRDFWVIEVAARRLHTFRDPRPDADAKHGYSYQQVRAHSQFALVSPLAADIHLAQVANLLPW